MRPASRLRRSLLQTLPSAPVSIELTGYSIGRAALCGASASPSKAPEAPGTAALPMQGYRTNRYGHPSIQTNRCTSVACPKFVPGLVVHSDTRHRWGNWPKAKGGAEPPERVPATCHKYGNTGIRRPPSPSVGASEDSRIELWTRCTSVWVSCRTHPQRGYTRAGSGENALPRGGRVARQP